MSTEFKTSHNIPDIYAKCKERFNVDWDEGIVITYGDVVYSKYELSPSLIVHEGVHVKQQTEMGVEKWWDKYFDDKEFRLSQEVEAYRAQIRFIRDNVKDRNEVFRYCNKIWKSMVKLYGSMCNYEEAKKLTE